MQPTDNQKWRAVTECDAAYDGRFFYAVRTVGVYCRPSCKSRTPLRKNVCFFDGAEAAQAAGFRPCKRCRPDLADFAPTAQLAEQVKALLDARCREKASLKELLRSPAASPNHLCAVFKRQYGLPPGAYRSRLRAQYAAQQLAQTEEPIAQIALDTGFDSLSAFCGFFKKQHGATPGNYRKEQRR